MENVPICIQCGNPIHRNAGDSEKYWRSREFCSWACRAASKVEAAPKCLGCGEDIPRRPGQSRVNWMQREYCGWACRARSKESKLGSRKCEHCGEEIARKEGQPVSAWRTLRFCSMECSSAARLDASFNGETVRMEAPDTKVCPMCGREFGSSRPKGRKDYNWVKQIYCSKACARESAISPDATILAVRLRGRKFLKPCCERCSTTERLTVHHSDRNPYNNTPENVLTLCPACHAKEHVGDIEGRVLVEDLSLLGPLEEKFGLSRETSKAVLWRVIYGATRRILESEFGIALTESELYELNSEIAKRKTPQE